MPRRLRECDTLGEFLADHAVHKRAQSASWTFGVWARRLGLRHTATLTRLVNGDRLPSEALSAALAAYFAFDADELEYWECLQLRGRAAAGSTLAALIDARLYELRTRSAPDAVAAAAVAHADQPVVAIARGAQVSLRGVADLDGAAAVLERHGLVPIPADQRAVVGLSVGHHEDTSVGPYSEFHVGILARERGPASSAMGVCFPLVVCSRLPVATLGMVIWGNDSRVGSIDWGAVERGWRAEVAVGDGRLRLAGGFQVAEAVVPNHIELQGFGQAAGEPTRFRLAFRSRRGSAPFDPTTDAFAVTAWPQLDELLGRLRFQPVGWEFHHALACDIHAPVRLTGS